MVSDRRHGVKSGAHGDRVETLLLLFVGLTIMALPNHGSAFFFSHVQRRLTHRTSKAPLSERDF
jgi:hypothetical protein